MHVRELWLGAIIALAMLAAAAIAPGADWLETLLAAAWVTLSGARR
jgi:hypothetical protein